LTEKLPSGVWQGRRPDVPMITPQADGQSLKGLTGRSLDSVVNLYKESVFLSISLRLFKVRHLIRKYLGFVWFTEYTLRME
jgi:hypothetical protein